MRPLPLVLPLSLSLLLAAAASIAVGGARADSCALVTSAFACTQVHAFSVMAASGCACFSCTERDGSGNYHCRDSPVCGTVYAVSGADADSTTLTRSSDAYFAIGAVFIAASLVAHAFLWVVARGQSVRKYVAENPAASTAAQSLWSRGYRFVHSKAFGSLLAADGKHTRRLTEYWVTESQLLDCFWRCGRRERPRRRLSLRLTRLASSLLVTASISFFFGTLEFDTATCTTYAEINLCSTSTAITTSSGLANPSLLHTLPDGVTSASIASTSQSSTTSTAIITTSGGARSGSMATTTSSGSGYGTTTSTTAGSSTSSSVVLSVMTENSCSAMPPIIGSLSKASSAIAFSVSHCVKFVGSYAQNLGRPGSKLDWGAHVLWFAVALAAIPVSAVLSTRLLSHGAYTFKSERLRMRLILSVTLSAWLQVQVADIFKVPVIYLGKKFGRVMLPTPSDGTQAMQTRACDLDCLGGQHKRVGKRDEDDDDGEPVKENALVQPRTTT